MTGQELYTNILTPTLGTEQIDQNYALALFELARADYEQRRPLVFLRAKDTSQIALAGQNLLTAYSMPSPATPSTTTPYLMSYLKEGTLRLTSATNVNNQITLREIAYEDQLDYIGENYFYTDYVNRKFYILATLPGSYVINQFFIADFGAITLTTSWNAIPVRFQPMLAFQAAARYRLGADYDDISARNADENYKSAEDLYKALLQLDARIAQQQATNRSFGAIAGGNGGYFPRPQGYDFFGPYA